MRTCHWASKLLTSHGEGRNHHGCGPRRASVFAEMRQDPLTNWLASSTLSADVPFHRGWDASARLRF